MSEENKPEIDEHTGVETTGHEWDGLKELNNPAPRWWLWIFYITIIWSVGYWIVYPSWPTLSGATKGVIGWTQFTKLEAEQAEIAARQQQFLEKFEPASFNQILNDQELYAFAVAGGRAAFKDNCATCHGTGAEGGKGYPNLNDDDWIWGGHVEEIYETLLYGIRSTHEETRYNIMPRFGVDGLLKREEVAIMTDYVLAISGGAKTGTFARGAEIFKSQCASCHGADGRGDHDFGAPNLTDAIWLYGGERQDVYESIFYARAGMMPHWQGRLDENTIRQLSVYVHEMGGGEGVKPEERAALDVQGVSLDARE